MIRKYKAAAKVNTQDTLLLLEKRVKSRFSHRMWRIVSPISADGAGWKALMRRALVPWEHEPDQGGKPGKELEEWKGDWQFAVEVRSNLISLDKDVC